MDVDTDPFSFDQMRDQLHLIQQAYLNYEENKSLCSRSHFLTRSFEEKSEESPDSKPNQYMLRFKIYKRRILRIIEKNII